MRFGSRKSSPNMNQPDPAMKFNLTPEDKTLITTANTTPNFNVKSLPKSDQHRLKQLEERGYVQLPPAPKRKGSWLSQPISKNDSVNSVPSSHIDSKTGEWHEWIRRRTRRRQPLRRTGFWIRRRFRRVSPKSERSSCNNLLPECLPWGNFSGITKPAAREDSDLDIPIWVKVADCDLNFELLFAPFMISSGSFCPAFLSAFNLSLIASDSAPSAFRRVIPFFQSLPWYDALHRVPSLPFRWNDEGNCSVSSGYTFPHAQTHFIFSESHSS